MADVECTHERTDETTLMGSDAPPLITCVDCGEHVSRREVSD